MFKSFMRYVVLLSVIFVSMFISVAPCNGGQEEDLDIKDIVIKEKKYDGIVSKNDRIPYEINANVTSKSGKLYKGRLNIEFYDAKNQRMPAQSGGYLTYDKERKGMYFYGTSFFPYKNWKSCKISQFGSSIEEITNVEQEGTKFEVVKITVGKDKKIRGDIINDSEIIYENGRLILEGFNDKWQNMGYMTIGLQYDEDRETMYFATPFWTAGMENWKNNKVLQHNSLSPLVEKESLEGFEIKNVVITVGTTNKENKLPHSIEGIIVCASGEAYSYGQVTIDIYDEHDKRLCKVKGDFSYQNEKQGMYFKQSFRDISPKDINKWKICKVVDYEVSENYKFDPVAEAKSKEEKNVWKEIDKIVRDKDYDKMKKFIQDGGDLNMPGFDWGWMVKGGTSILITAIETGDLEMIKLIVQNGADVNLGTKHGITPLALALRIAASSKNNTLEIVDYLREQGAVMNENKKTN